MLLAALTVTAGPAVAQDLPQLVRDAPDDAITLAFPARAGVCGAGDAILIREPDGSSMFLSGGATNRDWRSWRDGAPPCDVGDVLVSARRAGRELVDVRVRVGAPAGTSAVLARVSGQAAADYLLEIADRADAADARSLILAAALAGDAVRWPGLLRLAKDRALPTRTRKAALHWVGREAAAEVAGELGGVVRDRTESDEIREAAVFALTQLPDDLAVPLLIDVVRAVPEARIRGRALFWLAEFDDPRAIALFEEILTRE